MVPPMQLEQLAAYLDEYLRIRQVPDSSRAVNGLQVEGSRDVRRIAVAVDAAQAIIDRAVDAGADLLLVHHGLFWDGDPRVTGRRYRRLHALLQSGTALYSAHLPLDVHPEVGNNAVLARALGVDVQGTFGDYKGFPLGVWGTLPRLPRGAFATRLSETLGGPVRLIAGGPEQLETVGIITGGAASNTPSAAAAELDAFVTGEADNHHFFDAEEGGINLFLGGHYATETWGVRALAEHLEERFGLPHVFLDHPTGL